MKLPVFIFDPTASDSASKVRGVGRYVSVLRENLGNTVTFTSKLDQIPYESIYITPFYSFFQTYPSQRKIARYQLAVIHDLIPQKYPKHFPVGIKGTIKAFMNRLSLNNFDGFITDSKVSKEDIVDILGINKNSVHILYPVISSALFSEIKKAKGKESPKKPYFVYVGDATWNKNIINIAKGVKLAKAQCIFVGSVFQRSKIHSILKQNNKWLNELKTFYDEVQNDNHCILKGFVSDEELAELYYNAQGNILVSRDEGFGYSYLEAAYAHCPSILGDVPIFHETAADTALFANPEDPKKIAEQIEKLNYEKTRKELQKKMTDHIQKYNSTEFAKSFQAIIEQFQK